MFVFSFLSIEKVRDVLYGNDRVVLISASDATALGVSVGDQVCLSILFDIHHLCDWSTMFFLDCFGTWQCASKGDTNIISR